MKRHPYILATTIATLLAIVVWLCVPNEYTAYTKLSDEYKETELAIGFSSIKAHIKNAMGGANTGMNDMEIYCKVLKTENFANDIAHKRLPGKDMTYGQYVGKKDTVQAILDRINYNYSSRETTLRISFTDKDPLVASQMLDSITVQLQTIITRHRHIIVDSAMHNAMRALSATQEKYQRTMAEYGRFIDSHASINTSDLQEQEKALEKELKDTYALHEKAVEEYARQKALKERAYLSFAVIQDNTVPQHSDKYLMSYLLSFIFLAWILTYAILRSKDGRLRNLKLSQLGGYFSPWFLTIAIWTLILGLYYLLDTDLYPITKQFYYCFLLWVPIFCICSIGAYVLSAEGDDNSIRVSSILVCRCAMGSSQDSHLAGRHTGSGLSDELTGYHGEGYDVLRFRQFDVCALREESHPYTVYPDLRHSCYPSLLSLQSGTCRRRQRLSERGDTA